MHFQFAFGERAFPVSTLYVVTNSTSTIVKRYAHSTPKHASYELNLHPKRKHI